MKRITRYWWEPADGCSTCDGLKAGYKEATERFTLSGHYWDQMAIALEKLHKHREKTHNRRRKHGDSK